jgi:hypothetical protein
VPTPGVEDFLQRYPEFAEEETSRLEGFLVEAGLLVGDAWREAHRPHAVMALAAHLLVSDEQSAASYSSAVSNAETAAGVMTSKSVGPLTITKRPTAASRNASSGPSSYEGGRQPLTETSYGQTFLAFLRRSVPTSVLVV